MNPLFNLKQSAGQVPSLNMGIAGMTYDQHPPTRDVIGSNFPNGTIHIKYEVSGGKWWVPNKSYIRMRARLFQGDGTTPVTMADNVAPNMGLMANLFQSCEFRIADKCVSRVSEYVAQVDALEQRLSKSKCYLDGIGKTLNFWNHSQSQRAATVASDGCYMREEVPLVGIPQAQLAFNAADTLQGTIAAKTVRLDWILNAGAGEVADIRAVYKVGDVVEHDNGTKYTIVSFTTNLRAVSITEAVPANAGASNGFTLHRTNEGEYCPNRNEFEMIWKPPLSIFKVSHAMPSGSYEIQFIPETASVFEKAAIESLGIDQPVGGAGFKFDVVDMYLYLAVVEGPVVENLSYFLSLEETRCQTDNVDSNTGVQQKNFDVSPNSFALTCAFQDLEAGTDTRRSGSKFKVRQITGSETLYPSGELALRRLYLRYGGSTKPSPDADPDYRTPKDFLSSRYAETMLYSGAYFDQCSPEDKNDWLLRGPYYYFSWPRDGTSESTRVNVNYQFQTALTANSGRVLLFDHYKSMVMITVRSGKVVDVVSRE